MQTIKAQDLTEGHIGQVITMFPGIYEPDVTGKVLRVKRVDESLNLHLLKHERVEVLVEQSRPAGPYTSSFSLMPWDEVRVEDPTPAQGKLTTPWVHVEDESSKQELQEVLGVLARVGAVDSTADTISVDSVFFEGITGPERADRVKELLEDLNVLRSCADVSKPRTCAALGPGHHIHINGPAAANLFYSGPATGLTTGRHRANQPSQASSPQPRH